jgi:hypothetical protein
MRLFRNIAFAAMLGGIAVSNAFAQDPLDDAPALHRTAERHKSAGRVRTLDKDERMTLLATALDERSWRSSEPDCSHLVHAIYEQAGFPYQYEPSTDLYAGAHSFVRVKSPRPGDLVVWRGHVGIVIKPSRHLFFSYLSSGPGTDNYEDSYWRHRGQPRFYRYVKNSCPACDSGWSHSRHSLRTDH